MKVLSSASDGPAWAPRSSMKLTSPAGAPVPYSTMSPALGIAME